MGVSMHAIFHACAWYLPVVCVRVCVKSTTCRLPSADGLGGSSLSNAGNAHHLPPRRLRAGARSAGLVCACERLEERRAVAVDEATAALSVPS